MVYAQVITPGYRIVLQADAEYHEIHTGEQLDSPVVTCPAS
jgi:hypothetical protein